MQKVSLAGALTATSASDETRHDGKSRCGYQQTGCIKQKLLLGETCVELLFDTLLCRTRENDGSPHFNHSLRLYLHISIAAIFF